MVYFEISLTIKLYITIVFTKILWIFQDTLLIKTYFCAIWQSNSLLLSCFNLNRFY